ncbi:hypothetical protein ES703_81518 [subsurface metagenome]
MVRRGKNRNTKLMVMPGRFRSGFLGEFDKRTGIFRLLNDAYSEVVNDLGGEANLSHITITLAERFVFLEHMVQDLEAQIAQRMIENPTKTAKLLGRWIYAAQRLGGLAKTLGLERKTKQIESNLKSYVKGKNVRSKKKKKYEQ